MSSNTNFTPGEWTANEDDGYHYVSAPHLSYSYVFECGADGDTARADALLGAASKDMYTALQPFAELAREVIKDFSPEAKDDVWVNIAEWWGCDLGHLRALLTALSKAEGANK